MSFRGAHTRQPCALGTIFVGAQTAAYARVLLQGSVLPKLKPQGVKIAPFPFCPHCVDDILESMKTEENLFTHYLLSISYVPGTVLSYGNKCDMLFVLRGVCGLVDESNNQQNEQKN